MKLYTYDAAPNPRRLALFMKYKGISLDSQQVDLGTGEQSWLRDLHQDYDLEDDIFAVGCSPGIDDGRLVVNVGATEQQAGVVALSGDVAAAVAYFASDGAEYVTGQILSVSGGLTMAG